MADEPTRPDAPNQQMVRPDASHPADEGTGGSGGDTDDAAREDANELDAMTKAQLHAYANESGVQVTDDMTKAEMREAIERGTT